ncbi:beta strand repeat-containing protein, partial [Thalassolituus maritimus]|uniref:beta strand repeat-containing protein n=1 Tax=Thalassolituus maritimus TaxID=484498 RepID=UPI003342339C
AGADTFEVTGTNALTSAGIDFSNVEVVNAGSGTDLANDSAQYIDQVDVKIATGAELVANNSNAIEAGDIDFKDIESVELNNNILTGTSGADTFDVTGTNALTSAGISFSNVEVVNADEGADQVNTDGADASLFAELGSAVDYALETLGITFRDTENVDLNDGTLAGSSEADSFEVTGTTLAANAINVTNAASAIDAGAGDDAVTVNDTYSTLTGTDNALNTANYQFTSIQAADLNSNALTGTSGADTFDVTAVNSLTSAGVNFINVAVVDGGNGATDGDLPVNDKVNTGGLNASLSGVGIGSVTAGEVLFLQVEEVDLAGGDFSGSDQNDVFEVTGTVLTANGITVTNAASTIDAGIGDDAVTVNDANSTLTGTDNALNTAAYQFSSIASANLRSNALTGTDGADTFDVTGANALSSAG